MYMMKILAKHLGLSQSDFNEELWCDVVFWAKHMKAQATDLDGM